MVKVKICGNTNVDDVKLAKEYGADFIGFIFTKSKREINAKEAHKIITQMPSFKNFVGVFSNQPKNEVEEIARFLNLSWLQFHGEETSRYCHSFMENGYHVIKTFHIKDSLSIKRIDEYNVSAFLFDTYSSSQKGGTGKAFDWNLISNVPYILDRLFLAGGLSVSNLQEAIRKVKPYAVDVASGVEKTFGKKDPELLREFIQIAKSGRKAMVNK